MSTGLAVERWFVPARHDQQRRLGLFCIPHAGAGASAFRAWTTVLPNDIEVSAVQLPGRENRIRDAPYVRLAPLIEPLSAAFARRTEGRPYVLFGHSMGALIAFELARQLRRQRKAGPRQLIVSGHRAPHLASRDPPIHRLSDASFVAALHRLGGTPEGALQHPELRRLLLPVLRADIALCETYEYTHDPPLECPILACGGLDDDKVNRDELLGWAQHTSGACRVAQFPGGHFYLFDASRRMVDALGAELTSLELTRP